MSRRLRILLSAERDVEDAAAFIGRDSSVAALRFYDAVDQACFEILQYPRRSPRYESRNAKVTGIRKRAVKGFANYLVLYRV